MQKSTSLILIVDDSAIMFDRLIQMIREAGLMHDIVYANSYQEALKQLKNLQPDVIFFDISLPDGNGIDLLRMARTIHPDAKSIMITNHANEYYKRLCISLGAFSFLDKSKDFDRIPEYISRFSPVRVS